MTKSNPKQVLLTVSIGTKLKDRDPRQPNRIGTVVSIGSRGIGVRWNASGVTTIINPKRLSKYDVVR